MPEEIVPNKLRVIFCDRCGRPMTCRCGLCVLTDVGKQFTRESYEELHPRGHIVHTIDSCILHVVETQQNQQVDDENA